MGSQTFIAASVLLLVTGTSVAAHEWYSGLLSPRSNVSCCNDKDCRVVDLCVLPNGQEGIKLRAGCTEIERDVILPMPSPDGQTHVCVERTWMYEFQRCVILGGSA